MTEIMTRGGTAVRGFAIRLAAAVAGLAMLPLAGCAPPAGLDGDLTGGWRGFAEPVSWLPEAGTCHQAGYQRFSSLHGYHPVACAQLHETETAHVGELTGAAADRVTPPPEGSPEWREAYAACDGAAAGYLGADFRYGRLLWLGVSVPSVAAWEGGARWFRCELVVQYDASGGSLEDRTGSLAGALENGSGLRLGCSQAVPIEDTDDVRLEPVGCDEPHNAEFVGVWQAPDVPFLAPDGDADTDAAVQVHRGCREQVAAYVDVPVDGDLRFRTGTIATWMSEEDWDNGNRGFRCYLSLPDRELTESLQGAGPTGLPVL